MTYACHRSRALHLLNPPGRTKHRTQAAPEGTPGYSALCPTQGGEGPKAAHQASPEGTPGSLVDATLCPGPSRHQETRDSWTPRWQCGSRLQGTRNEDGNVPTPRSVSPHGDRDPGLTPHGDRAHAAKTNDSPRTKRRSNERTRNAEKGCLPCSVGTRGQPRGQDGQGACRGRSYIDCCNVIEQSFNIRS